ncbi:MAG TPA: hypothetical protein VF519_10385 [Mycobacteriales bacterium]|jgi:hypothetical protein
MKQPRRLALRREALADLTPTDLAHVQGGIQYLTARPCVLDDSVRVCSAFCQMTFNTCDC